MRTDRLKLIAVIVAVLWIVAQMVVIISNWNYEQTADAWHYMEEAITHYQTGELYPSRMDLYDVFIQSPGMCNYLMMIYAVFGHFKVAILINLLMNFLILGEIFYIGKRFFSINTALISVIIYCLIPTIVFAPIYILTEIPFLFFSLSAFTLSASKSYRNLLVASLLYFIAYMFRPTVMAFAFASVLYHLFNHSNWKVYIVGVLPFVLCVYGTGLYFKSTTGYFITSSSTGGQNLLMSIDDDAKLGGFNSAILTDSTKTTWIPDKEHKTFHEKDSIYKTMAIQMIKDHPQRYIKNIILKIPMMFQYDEWSWPRKWYYFENEPNPNVWKIRASLFLVSIPYMFVCLLFFISIIYNRKILFTPLNLAIVSVVFVYVIGSCLLTIENRYHFPFVWAMVVWGAYGIDSYQKNKYAGKDSRLDI